MLNKTVKFDEIQHRIDAARSLQDAGQDDMCKTILVSLAKDILEGLK